MANLDILRDSVDLPAGYNAELPASERKAMLRQSLAEYQFRNKFLGLVHIIPPVIIKPAEGRKFSRPTRNTKSARIVRFIASKGRANPREISVGTGIDMASVSPLLCALQTDKLVFVRGSKRFNGGRMMKAVAVTKAGLIYGEKD